MPTINNPFTPPEDRSNVADEIAKNIAHKASSVSRVLVRAHQEIYNALWEESISRGTTPQAVLDSEFIGTDATELFNRGSQLVEFILTTGIATMTPDEYTPKQVPTFNEDGTVTLAEAE